ncbi:MAG: phosphoribosyl-AMP cyclohydrolase [Pseudonocardiaceae bacterium]
MSGLDRGLNPAIAARLKRNADGLVCAVVQRRGTGEVLMVAWMDDEALHRTLSTGRATYWSRSRQAYWVKGETSGHTQHVREVRLDCDGDALLLIVDQVGPACHTGAATCFSRSLPVSGNVSYRSQRHSQDASQVPLEVRGDRGDDGVGVG